MDPVKILKRSWQILWSYKALWVFGLILALTAAGSSGGSGNSGSRYNVDPSDQQYDLPLADDFSENFQKAFEEAGEDLGEVFEEGLSAAGISDSEVTALIWIGALFILVMLVLGIVMSIARYVSETAVIRMVDEYEATDTKMTVRGGFRIGWSRTSWRLFLINFIINLPVLLLLVVLGIVGFMMYTAFAGRGEPFAIAGIVGLIGIAFLAIFVIAIISTLLRLLRQFFWRAAALEGLGVRESLSRGFAMARENWKNVGLMWLVMMGLGIVWMIVSFISFFVLLPVAFFTAIFGAVIAAIPGMLLVGFFSLFLSGPLPWIVGGIIILPLFFTLAFSPWILLTAWQQVYVSTVWTLTYREIKALPALASVMEGELIEK